MQMLPTWSPLPEVDKSQTDMMKQRKDLEKDLPAEQINKLMSLVDSSGDRGEWDGGYATYEGRKRAESTALANTDDRGLYVPVSLTTIEPTNSQGFTRSEAQDRINRNIEHLQMQLSVQSALLPVNEKDWTPRDHDTARRITEANTMLNKAIANLPTAALTGDAAERALC